jgi:uncharacterized protein (DUF983 family)
MHVYSTEDPRLMNVKETLECPKCGKRCLVEKSSNHYHCLWCHFDRNINNDPEDGNAIAFVVGVLLIMALMFVVTSGNNRSRDRSLIPDSGAVEVALR